MNLAEMLAAAEKASEGVETNSERKQFALITPGTYDAVVAEANGPKDSSRTNPNNPNEHGKYIELKMQIVGGEFDGRYLWVNNNIIVYPASNSEEDGRKAQVAMAIGASERKVMLASIGKVTIEDAAELVGAQVKAEVIIRKNNKGEDKNSVKRISSSSSSQKTAAAPSPVKQEKPSAETNPAPKKSAKKMPWEV